MLKINLFVSNEFVYLCENFKNMTTSKKIIMKSNLKNKTAFGHDLHKDFDQRRKVMSIIYEIKKRGFNIPRIEIRIVSGGEETNCGYAYLSKNIVHINSNFINDVRLTHIVLHEVVHAVAGVKHDDSCYLMQPLVPNEVNIEKSWKSFSKYIK